jgi:hypothetical protein
MVKCHLRKQTWLSYGEVWQILSIFPVALEQTLGRIACSQEYHGTPAEVIEGVER